MPVRLALQETAMTIINLTDGPAPESRNPEDRVLSKVSRSSDQSHGGSGLIDASSSIAVQREAADGSMVDATPKPPADEAKPTPRPPFVPTQPAHEAVPTFNLGTPPAVRVRTPLGRMRIPVDHVAVGDKVIVLGFLPSCELEFEAPTASATEPFLLSVGDTEYACISDGWMASMGDLSLAMFVRTE